MEIRNLIKKESKVVFVSLVIMFYSCSPGNEKSDRHLYDLGDGIHSRSISFENPTGEQGLGGKASSNLGVGRKGFPAKGIAPGETLEISVPIYTNNYPQSVTIFSTNYPQFGTYIGFADKVSLINI